MDSLVHTGGMGRESAGKWANRHPKDAGYSMHYTFLETRYDTRASPGRIPMRIRDLMIVATALSATCLTNTAAKAADEPGSPCSTTVVRAW